MKIILISRRTTKQCVFVLSVFVILMVLTIIVSGANKAMLVKQSGSYSSSTTYNTNVIYKNKQYRFLFSLPESWKGYSIVTDNWQGYVQGDQGIKTITTGPIISIRHPQWTFKNPRQDIPIMIFTLGQWNSLQKGEFFVSAAPVNPTEINRNSKYVFALPPRYNYSFLPGYGEVEKILDGNPLKFSC
jgi:hypothetical protein